MHPVRMGSNFSLRLQHNFGWRFAVQVRSALRERASRARAWALCQLCRLEGAAVVTVTLAPRQIGIMYVCVKGLLNSTLGLVKLSYCKKTLHIDGNACQTMGSIAMTPWSIKGVFGVLSDSYVSHILLSVLCALAVLMARGTHTDTCFNGTLTTTCDMLCTAGCRYPLLGYHKKWYIIISSVFGVGAFIGLAALPIDSANVAALFIFLANIQVGAVGDKIVEEAQGAGGAEGETFRIARRRHAAAAVFKKVYGVGGDKRRRSGTGLRPDTLPAREDGGEGRGVPYPFSRDGVCVCTLACPPPLAAGRLRRRTCYVKASTQS